MKYYPAARESDINPENTRYAARRLGINPKEIKWLRFKR